MASFFRIALLLFITQLPQFAFSQTSFVDSLLRAARRQQPELGLVVGIYQHGSTHYYATGNRTGNGSLPVDSNTLFEVGSATKTFTALLLAQAIAEGRVRPDERIDALLPTGVQLAPALRQTVRLTDLAAHRSGLPNLSSDAYFDALLARDARNPFRFVDSAYLINLLQHTDSLRGYGQYHYNNFAFALLGRLLARGSGRSYERMIEEDLLRPLGMNATSFAIPGGGNRAGLYAQRGAPQDYLVLNAMAPAGGLKSNAVDLMRYLRACVRPGFLRPALRIAEAPYYSGADRSVGLGWEIGDGFYEKDGDTFGNSCLLRYSPQNDLAVVVLSNHQNGALVRSLANAVYAQLLR